MLGPVVEMFSKPVGYGDVGILIGAAEFVERTREGVRQRVARHVSMKWIPDRRFGRFVVLRERAFDQIRGEKLRHSFRQHDEGSEIARRGVGFVIRHVSGPALAVPLYGRAQRVPAFAGGVGGGAIVEDSPVGRPAPAPLSYSVSRSRSVCRYRS